MHSLAVPKRRRQVVPRYISGQTLSSLVTFLWFSHSSLFVPMIKDLKVHGGESLRHYQQLSCCKHSTDLKNPEIHSHVQKGSSGFPHLRPINLAHTLPPYLFNNNFNVILFSTSTYPEKNSVLFSFLLCHSSTQGNFPPFINEMNSN